MNYIDLVAIILVCATVLIFQHRSFSATKYAAMRQQIAATQAAVAQANAWMIQIATYLKVNLSKPPEKTK